MSGRSIMGQLADDHQALAGALAGFGLSPLKAVKLAVTSKTFDSVAAAEEEVARELERVTAGWLRRESWAGLWHDDPGEPSAGVLLDGEWALEGEASLSLFYDGRSWRLLKYDEAATGGVEVLREDIRMLGHRDRWLTYAVYWGGDQDGVVRRVASRLTGFQEG